MPGPGIAAAAARREAFVRASAFVFIHALRVRFALNVLFELLCLGGGTYHLASTKPQAHTQRTKAEARDQPAAKQDTTFCTAPA